MRILVDGKKLALALQRLEFLYWHLRRNGGPDLEVRQIQRLQQLHKAGKEIYAHADSLSIREYTLPEGGTIGLAQTEEVRQAMQQLHKAGKEIYAHADSLSMREYTLLCGASRLSVVPTADLWLMGLAGEGVYLRGLLDKLGVTPDYLTCGAYKSAAETFMRTGPSPEADKMQNWLFDGLSIPPSS